MEGQSPTLKDNTQVSIVNKNGTAQVTPEK